MSALWFERGTAVILVLALSGALSACSGDLEELQQWTEAKRREAKPSVPKLLPPKKFDPEPYTSGQAVDPFSNQKLAVALKQDARQQNPLLASELSRRKEPLEAYPLDTMRMVGSLMRNGSLVALVKVDSLLYQVRAGSYLGQNYGRVNEITETELTLREIVQDPSGEWTERPAALQLQEDASK